MTTMNPDGPKQPLIHQYNKTPEISQAHVFKLRPEELKLIFQKEHIELPTNEGEKRESLVILEKVGLVRGLLKSLNTEAETGIVGDSKDIQRRQKFFGKNVKPLPKLKSIWRIIWSQYDDYTLRVLFWIAVVTTVLGVFVSSVPLAWIEGVSIFAALILIVSISSFCDNLKEKQFLKLSKEIVSAEIQVIRGQYGTSQTIKVLELVVGDVVVIEAGMRVPADCILISGRDVVCDESDRNLDSHGDEALERVVKQLSDPEGENHRENPDIFLKNDSLVTSGSGLAVVCAVGENVQNWDDEMAESLSKQPDTPLQERLEKLAEIIGKFAYYSGFLIFFFMSLFLLMKLIFAKGELLSNETLMKLINNFTVGVTIVIVSVPEGLPLAVSMALAFSVDTMKAENLLVKKTKACETIGTVHNICTGKTGTLTQNKMQVVKMMLSDNDHYSAEQEDAEAAGNTFFDKWALDPKFIDVLTDGIIFNQSARVEMSEENSYVPQGNGTECCMLKFLQTNEVDIQDQMVRMSRFCSVETEIPFNGEFKRQLVAIKFERDGQTMVRVVVKGAPEYVIPMCTTRLTSQFDVEDLDESEGNDLLKTLEANYAKKDGLRLFTYAYKDYELYDFNDMKEMNGGFATIENRQSLERDLTHIASFGLQDPIRLGVRDAIEKLKTGGIDVQMISGDNIETARFKAQEVGILDEEMNPEVTRSGFKDVMTGAEFRSLCGPVIETKDEEGVVVRQLQMQDNFQKQVAPHVKVLARATPEDKYAFIVGLKKHGGCVAVTGDGMNDDRALQYADVGFAMGISGCEVAKDAADIVILDDNFCSVFRATQYGRSIFDNIRKFIQFQMTINIVTVFIVFLGGATLGESPFNVIQLLWINLIMDTLAAISLATEPPHETQLSTTKIRPADGFITKVMWRNILSQSLYQIIIMIILLYFGPLMTGHNYDYINTGFATNATAVAMPAAAVHLPITAPKVNMTLTAAQNSTNTANAAKNAASIKTFNAGVAAYDAYMGPSYKLEHYTLMFMTFIFMTLFNQINSRKLELKEINVFAGFFNNPFFVFILFIELAFTLFMSYTGQTLVIFRTVPMDWKMWLMAVCFGIGSLLVAIAVKYVPEDKVLAIPQIMDEEDNGTDFMSRQYRRFTKVEDKDETQKLIDGF